MTPIADLLKKAAEALPPQKPRRSKWAQFAPVVRELESKGHSVQSAVDWIISEGGIYLRTPQHRVSKSPPTFRTSEP